MTNLDARRKPLNNIMEELELQDSPLFDYEDIKSASFRNSLNYSTPISPNSRNRGQKIEV